MDYKKQLAKLIALDGFSQGEIESYITPAAEVSFGDYSLPCFRFSKACKKAPNAIAAELAASISAKLPDFLKAVCAVGGYLNFTLDRERAARAALEEVLQNGAAYGESGEGKGKTVCIDYSSINIAKPFHIGHLGTTV
ncbi:MAG: arginine--tRNA ligase, partial [Clostridiales bacterium]|nr:arginine--tRNA ligase [Clostridiales bacterium]